MSGGTLQNLESEVRANFVEEIVNLVHRFDAAGKKYVEAQEAPRNRTGNWIEAPNEDEQEMIQYWRDISLQREEDIVNLLDRGPLPLYDE